MLVYYIILIVISIIVALLRLFGINNLIYASISHVFVGAILGAALTLSLQGHWASVTFWLVFVGLCAAEIYTFVKGPVAKL